MDHSGRSRLRFWTCLFFSLFASLGALARAWVTDSIYQNASNARSVVEVVASLKGSGVIVMLDDRPVVVTNSHNLQGKKSAHVILSRRPITYLSDDPSKHIEPFQSFEINLDLPVISDFPLTDFALLGFPDDLSEVEKAALQYYAGQNGTFCVNLPRCRPGWHANTTSGVEFTNNIAVVLDGKPTSIDLVNYNGPSFDPRNPKKDQDKFQLPVYARPGVSGGAYYQRGVLSGLVTEVSLTGEPFASATTFEKLGKTLTRPDASEAGPHWTEDGKLVIDVNGEQIILHSGSKGGGETGHGGGETGHGGGETGHGGSGPDGSYWKLQVSDAQGEHEISTWNPFRNRFSTFNINGENILALKAKDKFKLPSLEAYRKNREHLSDTEDNRRLIESLRGARPPFLNIGRYYDLVGQTFELGKMFRFYSGSFAGGQLLLPDASGKWSVNQPALSATGRTPDQDGYYVNFPFSARRSPGFILDVQLHTYAHADTTITVKATSDLQSLTFTKEGPRVGTPVHAQLKRVPFPSVATLLFEDKESGIKAVYLYDADDLVTIDRIYIQTPDTLLEFWSLK